MNLSSLCSQIFPKFLVISSNVPPLVYYSHITAIALSSILAVFILVNSKKILSSKVLFLMLASFIVWVLLDSVFWASNHGTVTMFVWSMQILVEPLVYIWALYLIYVLAFKEDISFLYKILIGLLYLPVIIFTPTHYTLSAFNVSDCLSVEGFFGYYAYVIEFIYVFAIIAIASNRYRKSNDPSFKKQLFYITIGILLFLFSFSWGNIVSSFTDVWQISQIGLFTMPIFVVFLVYTIVKFKTFNIRLLGAQALVITLIFLIGTQFIFITTPLSRMLNGATFLLAIVFGSFLIKGVKKEVEQRQRLEHLTQSLEEANTQLKSLDKLKSEFISLASHQLRSPLTVIKGYASTLTDGVVGDLNEKQREVARHIYTSAQGLAFVVEDFLNVTKIEQGGMKYVFEPTNIKQIVEDLGNDMKIIAEDKNLSFTSSIDIQDVCMVEADGVKIKQVFLNLVDNSIKYTKEGYVKISLTKNDTEKTVIFMVSDSGVGLSEETKKKLFTKFGRGEGATLNAGGSGLGLYLAQEIVEAHHGKIVVESEGVGKGASFSVVLPCIQ